MSDFHITDFIPHGMVTALAGVVGYVFREHVKTDATRFKELTDAIEKASDRQTEIMAKMEANHAEVLKQFIYAGQHAAMNAAIAEGLERREL